MDILQPSVFPIAKACLCIQHVVLDLANSPISRADGTLPAALLLHRPRILPFGSRRSRVLFLPSVPRAGRHRNPPQAKTRCPPSLTLTFLSDSPLHLPAPHSVGRQRN